MRHGEQKRLLQDEGDLLAQALESHVADVLPVEQHAAGPGVEEARQQPGQGRLARAGRADEGERLAGAQLQGHAAQHRPVGIVAEAHVVQAHVPAQGRQGPRPRRSRTSGSASNSSMSRSTLALAPCNLR